MQPRNVTACLSRLHLASSRPQPSPPPDACKKASVRGVTAGNSHMLGLRSATSSLLARSFASAVPKFDPSKLNGFIKGNDAKMEAMSFSKAVSEMEKVVESAPANKPVRWDHWAQTIRKTTVVAKYKAAAANLKPRKIQNTWSPVLKQNLQKIVDASNAQKAASDKRIAELKTVLTEINARKGGREMTIDEAMAAFPESAKKINQDIADNKWFS